MGDNGARYEYHNHKQDPPQNVPSSVPAEWCTHPLRQGITEVHCALSIMKRGKRERESGKGRGRGRRRERGKGRGWTRGRMQCIYQSYPELGTRHSKARHVCTGMHSANVCVASHIPWSACRWWPRRRREGGPQRQGLQGLRRQRVPRGVERSRAGHWGGLPGWGKQGRRDREWDLV